MIKHDVHITLLCLTLCFGVTAQAQNITTLTPDPFDASGGLAVGADGNIFVANMGASSSDPGGNEVYRITPEGSVNLFVNGLSGASGNSFDSQGNLFQANFNNNQISKITPAGVITEFAGNGAGLSGPVGVTFDSQGNLFVANCSARNILKLSPGGEGSVFAMGPEFFNCPVGIEADDQDNLYVSNFHNPLIIKITPAGSASIFADTEPWTGSNAKNQMMVFADDRLYLASEGAHQVLELSMEGTVSVLAGTGEKGNTDGPLLQSTLSRPWGIDISLDGRKLYVTTSDPPPSSSLSWTPNLVRVIELPGIGEEGFQINNGLNDAWFNLTTNGQGFLITVFPDIKQMFLAWFTYDTERPPEDVTANLGEPGHRWLTAQGPYDGDTANLTIFVTEGGIFDAVEPVAETDPAGDGTMTIEFADCTEGLVNYQITSLDISGEIPIQRITPDNVPLCEVLEEQLLQK